MGTPIETITRFRVSTGKIYEDRAQAIKSQESINKSELSSYMKTAWKGFIKKRANDEEPNIWNGIVNDKYGIRDFESVFTELFVGDGTPESINNRQDLISLLNDILHKRDDFERK